MNVDSVWSLDSWKSRLQSAWSYDPEDRAYIAVLVGLILTMLGFYYLSLGAESRETIILPRLTIYATLILLAGALINAFFDIGRVITPDESEGEREELFDTGTNLSFDLSYTRLARKVGVIVLYFLGVFYIGFFTVSTVFTFLYVFFNTDRTDTQRWIRAASVTILTVGALWTIFVYLLGMIQLFRLGPLP